MVGAIVRAALTHRMAVLSVAMLLALAGVLAMTRLDVDVLPDINRPQLTVMTEAPGLAAEDVEALVTKPLELALMGLPSTLRMRSSSILGLSIVTVELDWGSDVQAVRQQAAERLSAQRLATGRGEIPAGLTAHLQPVSSIMGEIMLVAVTAGPDTDAMRLRAIAEWTVRPRLLALPGVSQVTVIGGAARQYRVAPDPALLNALDITAAEIERALAGVGLPTGGGFTAGAGRGEAIVRAAGATVTPQALAAVMVSTRSGAMIPLGQVAAISEAARPERGAGGFGGADAVILSVQKQTGADTLRLTPAVDATLAELQRTMPAGVKVDQVLFRQADFIGFALANVARALLEAAFVVAIVLYLFLGSGRTTLISLIAIPLSMLAAVLVLRYLGISINTLTLGGIAIAIGELVDDAVVDVENVVRRLRENAALAIPQPMLTVIADASSEVRTGIVTASVIIMLVITPLFLLGGMEGQLLRPLALAYVLAMAASLLTAITVTPALCALLLKGDQVQGDRGPRVETPVARGCKNLMARTLTWAIPRERVVLGAALGAAIIAAIAATALPRALMPQFNEGSMTVTLSASPGIALVDSVALGRMAERLLLEIPEVAMVGRRTGRAELDEHAQGVETSEIDIALKPGGRSRAQIARDIRERLALLPGAVNLGQPISHRLDHLTAGVRAGLVLKITGEDLQTLESLGGQLVGALGGIAGLKDLQIEQQTLVPTVEVRTDLSRSAMHGVPQGLAASTVGSLVNGRTLSHVLEGSERVEVVMRLEEGARTHEGLAAVLVDTPLGRVPLSSVAEISEGVSRSRIERENGQRRLAVLANLDGGDAGAAIDAVRHRIAALALPPGYAVSIEGTYLAQAAASRTLLSVGALVLAGVLAILLARYRSAVLALIVLASVPLALTGGVAALALAGLPLSLAAAVGFITVAGLAVRNSILRVSHVLNLGLREHVPFGDGLLMRASLERLTPVLMTALAAAGALLPLVLGADAPGKEILHPVAVVVFGGIVTATLLDALVTPLLLRRFAAGSFAAAMEAGARAPQEAGY